MFTASMKWSKDLSTWIRRRRPSRRYLGLWSDTPKLTWETPAHWCMALKPSPATKRHCVSPCVASPLAGNQVAWTIALSLREFTYGGGLEDVSATIARAVIVQPRAFLRAAKARLGSGALHALEFMGVEFVDKPVAKRCQALRQRLNAIRGVGDPTVVEVRD